MWEVCQNSFINSHVHRACIAKEREKGKKKSSWAGGMWAWFCWTISMCLELVLNSKCIEILHYFRFLR